MASRAEERMQRQSARNGWLLSLPALGLLLIAALGPLLIIFVYSVLTPGQYGNVVWEFSWDGWVSILFTRDIFDGTLGLADAHLTIFWRSVSLSLMTTLATFALGFPTAWFIATRPPRQRGLWLFLITIPFWTNLLIRTFALIAVLREQGYVNFALEWLWNNASGFMTLIGLQPLGEYEPLTLLYNNTAVIIGLVYVHLPFMVLPLYSALDRMDRSLMEASLDLGAGHLRTIWKVVVPLAAPGIASGILITFIPALGAYLTPDLLGGTDSQMIANVIERQFKRANDWPFGAALSFLLMYLTFIAIAVQALVQRRSDRRS